MYWQDVWWVSYCDRETLRQTPRFRCLGLKLNPTQGGFFLTKWWHCIPSTRCSNRYRSFVSSSLLNCDEKKGLLIELPYAAFPAGCWQSCPAQHFLFSWPPKVSVQSPNLLGNRVLGCTAWIFSWLNTRACMNSKDLTMGSWAPAMLA